MYVVTFYSYKGGVGRTLALVNVAALLAKQGRRVLAVDFDLEAPSLPDFDFFNPAIGRKGVVDYVSEYRATGIAPSCHDFIVPCEVAGHPIWVMPAGRSTEPGYTDRLNDIDWKELYEEQDGFLLFEDLKQQWAQFEGRGFDYVLLDSRTGHTDVGGICTRQLPNAVSIMFLPNASNISGLLPIVESIREENNYRGSEIQLHITPTNVPDLDDEKGILAKLMTEASDVLNQGREFELVIHHYQSLDVLETGPFATSRPNSKLSKEYEKLRLQIIGQNFEDREGAIYSLGAIPDELDKARASNDTLKRESLLEKTKNILFRHPRDGEVGFLAAQAFDSLGDQTFEMEALGVAIEHGYEVDRARLIRGIKSISIGGNTDNACNDLMEVLSSESATAFEVIPALEILGDITNNWPDAVQRALNKPDEKYKTILSVVAHLMDSREATPYCAQRLLSLGEFNGLSENARKRVENYASLCLIASGQFQAALDYIDNSQDASSGSRDPQSLFNRAMAIWGINRTPPLNLLEEFVALPEMLKPDYSVNTRQCLAMTYGVLGEKDEALSQLELAEQLLAPGETAFSCWTYLRASNEQLSKDFSEMRQSLERDEPMHPGFLDCASADHSLIH